MNTERLVERLAAVVSRRPATRRGFLTTATLAGAALATNPWGYLTRPQDAYASVCGPDASCGAGYTVFCCTLHGNNTCPPNTFIGGWWKADRSSYCGGSARYYLDCNAKPGHHFRCHCNQTTCDRRRVACNIFRYGQCNTQIDAVTAVVCRQISCTPPWKLYPNHCGRSSATDNNTLHHTAPCLNLRTFRAGHSTLVEGHAMHKYDRLVAPNRHTMCDFTSGGNLRVINQDGVVWSSRTKPAASGGRVYLRHDGDLVIQDRHRRTVWSTHTGGHSGRAVLRLLDDGRLVVRIGERILWQTHTHTP